MKTYTYDVIVVGTGAAGYNAACRLKQFGKNVALVTEDVNCGTSRNTGSDKQTYYKLGLGGKTSDSVFNMAQDLFNGGCVDGDNALCEAALSSRCFMNLCEVGVAFPVNRYGEYVGYKTDHDPYARATSAGPLTSKFMTETLQNKAEELKIKVFTDMLVVEILKCEERVCGILCIEKETGQFVAFKCGDIVLATGGPAGIYADSVYPVCHTGSSALALLAGAKVQNMTEWQYGLASVNPRWNVSGTYMQVLPRFVSIDEKGIEREFLLDYFDDMYEALSLVFLKGYQWPFDSKKVLNGSSIIDLLVYREAVLKKRKVYLDFTKNPFGLDEIDYQKLNDEAYMYLHKADASFGKPICRLLKMNAPAVELYQSKGIDITKEYLEISLCAQHHNGGIAVDMWWQTSVAGLFAVGECAGTHGVTRPGGSALNAGQVGSLRAAQYIAQYGNPIIDNELFSVIALAAQENHNAFLNRVVKNYDNIEEFTKKVQRRMSDSAAAIRNKEAIVSTFKITKTEYDNLLSVVGVSNLRSAWKFYKLKDILFMQMVMLYAIIDYINTAGDTRGSSLNYDVKGKLRKGLENDFRFCEENIENRSKIQEIIFDNGEFKVYWRNVRPLPENSDFFENVWRGYRENKNIF